ncbi:MAG: D-glycero-beta-D-manno-heptose-7-phosphate kinase, partial [Geobacter sp.]|nr:D-glycero-beta-D-manno-heptose-7-phosphate kinase [Geobacter sp.]
MDRRAVESFFSHTASLKALVIGDLMLDEYLWGKAERISPEAPVQVVDVQSDEIRLGGAGNVVNNLVALGCSVAVCSVIGDDASGGLLRTIFQDKGVDISALFSEPGRCTGKKSRVVASHQQIVRIDRETRAPISGDAEAAIINSITSRAADYNVLVVSDYLKGVLTNRVLAAIIAAGRTAGVPVVVDPKGADYSKYSGATIITPNRKEAEQAAGVMITDETSLKAAADKLLEQLGLSALLITRSEAGMSLFRENGATLHIPTVAREVYDVSGAGDTVLALLSLGIAAGMSMDDAAALANTAAGIAVGKLGTSTVSPAEIMAEIARGHLDSDNKIKNLDTLVTIIEAERAKGRRIAFTNGCFDLLHVGHVKYLQKARSFGDLLIMGLNSDASIKRLKGEKRPLIGQDERAHILAALDCIDYVVIFDEDTPLELITALKPDILVKGGDYTLEGVVGRE